MAEQFHDVSSSDPGLDPGSDPVWLKKNQDLRLDANSPFFRESQRRVHLERYEFARQYCSGKRVLDGACGTGYGSSLLGSVASEVVGIDFSAETVEYADKTYGAHNVSFRKSFVELTPFESRAFDVVVSFETVEHTLCPRAHLMEIARLLEPSAGRAILSVPNAWGYTDHHFFDFDFALFKQVTAEFFRDTEFLAQYAGSNGEGIRPIGSAGPAGDEPKPYCVVAICSGPRKEKLLDDRLDFVMGEIYGNAFSRHHDYLGLAYKVNTGIGKRGLNWLRSRLQG